MHDRPTVLDLFSGIGAFSRRNHRIDILHLLRYSRPMTNKYTYSVPFTEQELYEDYVVAGMTQREIGMKHGVSQKVVWRALQKMGIPARRAVPRDQKGAANNNWRGGRVLAPAKGNRPDFLDRGYWLVHSPNHPNATKQGYVYEHILNALDSAGLERLPDGHCVHHINLRKDDNAPSNLAICDHRTHQLYHRQLEALAVRILLDKGAIRFVDGVGYVEA